MNRLALLTFPLAAASMTDPGFKPWLRIEPGAIQLAPGATAAFRVNLNYPPGRNYLRPPVKWSVQEGASGGSVDVMGHYTAPDKAGTFHVIAERTDVEGIRAAAAITVR